MGQKGLNLLIEVIGMANTVEHKVPKKIKHLLNIKHPEYKVLSIVGTGVTDYYPALDKDGNTMSMMDYTIDEIMAAKVKRQRLTVRLQIDGNGVMLEDYIRSALGYDAMSISPGYVDIYVPLMGLNND